MKEMSVASVHGGKGSPKRAPVSAKANLPKSPLLTRQPSAANTIGREGIVKLGSRPRKSVLDFGSPTAKDSGAHPEISLQAANRNDVSLSVAAVDDIKKSLTPEITTPIRAPETPAPISRMGMGGSTGTPRTAYLDAISALPASNIPALNPITKDVVDAIVATAASNSSRSSLLSPRSSSVSKERHSNAEPTASTPGGALRLENLTASRVFAAPPKEGMALPPLVPRHFGTSSQMSTASHSSFVTAMGYSMAESKVGAEAPFSMGRRTQGAKLRESNVGAMMEEDDAIRTPLHVLLKRMGGAMPLPGLVSETGSPLQMLTGPALGESWGPGMKSGTGAGVGFATSDEAARIKTRLEAAMAAGDVAGSLTAYAQYTNALHGLLSNHQAKSERIALESAHAAGATWGNAAQVGEQAAASVAHAVKERDGLERQLQEQMNNYAELAQDHSDALAAAESASDQLDALRAKMVSRESELLARCANAEAQASSLREEAGSALPQEFLEDYDRLLAFKESMSDFVSRSIAAAGEREAQLMGEIKLLRQKLQAAQQEVHETGQEAGAAVSAMRNVEAEARSAERIAAECRAGQEAAEAAAENARDSIAALQREHARARAEMQAVVDGERVCREEAKMQAASESAARVMAESAASRTQLQLEQAELHVASLQAGLSARDRDLRDAHDCTAALQVQCSALREQMGEMFAALTAKEEEIATLQDAHDMVIMATAVAVQEQQAVDAAQSSVSQPMSPQLSVAWSVQKAHNGTPSRRSLFGTGPALFSPSAQAALDALEAFAQNTSVQTVVGSTDLDKRARGGDEDCMPTPASAASMNMSGRDNSLHFLSASYGPQEQSASERARANAPAHAHASLQPVLSSLHQHVVALAADRDSLARHASVLTQELAVARKANFRGSSTPSPDGPSPVQTAALAATPKGHGGPAAPASYLFSPPPVGTPSFMLMSRSLETSPAGSIGNMEAHRMPASVRALTAEVQALRDQVLSLQSVLDVSGEEHARLVASCTMARGEAESERARCSALQGRLEGVSKAVSEAQAETERLRTLLRSESEKGVDLAAQLALLRSSPLRSSVSVGTTPPPPTPGLASPYCMDYLSTSRDGDGEAARAMLSRSSLAMLSHMDGENVGNTRAPSTVLPARVLDGQDEARVAALEAMVQTQASALAEMRAAILRLSASPLVTPVIEDVQKVEAEVAHAPFAVVNAAFDVVQAHNQPVEASTVQASVDASTAPHPVQAPVSTRPPADRVIKRLSVTPSGVVDITYGRSRLAGVGMGTLVAPLDDGSLDSSCTSLTAASAEGGGERARQQEKEQEDTWALKVQRLEAQARLTRLIMPPQHMPTATARAPTAPIPQSEREGGAVQAKRRSKPERFGVAWPSPDKHVQILRRAEVQASHNMLSKAQAEAAAAIKVRATMLHEAEGDRGGEYNAMLTGNPDRLMRGYANGLAKLQADHEAGRPVHSDTAEFVAWAAQAVDKLRLRDRDAVSGPGSDVHRQDSRRRRTSLPPTCVPGGPGGGTERSHFPCAAPPSLAMQVPTRAWSVPPVFTALHRTAPGPAVQAAAAVAAPQASAGFGPIPHMCPQSVPPPTFAHVAWSSQPAPAPASVVHQGSSKPRAKSSFLRTSDIAVAVARGGSDEHDARRGMPATLPWGPTANASEAIAVGDWEDLKPAAAGGKCS